MIGQLFNLMIQLIRLLLNPVILIPVIIYASIYTYKNRKYKKGTYHQVTKTTYFDVRRNIGRYGEYLIYKNLEKFEEQGAKFLFNIYVPKKEEETTEIDVLMISNKGLFVFESKNYSGWIFGNDNQKYWYQTLPSGRGRSTKEKFYNPVFQNNTHVKYLKSLIGGDYPIYSIIAFSDRCTLMNVNIKYSKVSVVNRYQVYGIVSSIYENNLEDVLTNEQINEIYNIIYPYTQVDDVARQKHIDNINNKIRGNNNNVISVPVDENTPQSEDVNSTEEIIEIKNDLENPVEESNDIDNVDNKDGKDTLICPECGAKLVLRLAKYGEHAGEEFYGCSNYPRCKYIQKK
jgi:hypothetical protein